MEREGLGCFVTQTPTPLRKAVRTERLSEAVDSLIVQAQNLQLDDETLRQLLDQRLAHFTALRASAHGPQTLTRRQP